MRSWLPPLLLFLLAVPYQTFWIDYEVARRGLLAVLLGVLCLVPAARPQRVPVTVWPFCLLACWFLARSIGVTNPFYAIEAGTHVVALAVLLTIGTALPLGTLLTATIPTGLVVGLWTIAQGCGIPWFEPLPGVHEVTATLGNRNVAAEVLAVCGAGAALLATIEDADTTQRIRTLAIATVGVCAVALVINGSRSGLLALPLGCLPALLQPRRAGVVAALAAGLLLGQAVPFQGPPAAPMAPAGTAATATPAPSTIAVRLALWRGGWDMVKAAPLLGHGAGQFGTEYPRFRTREEEALSTFDRTFLAAPATAHNDYLQLVIEGGVPALLLGLLSLWVLVRRVPLRHWGPLVAFGVLAGVRAPLYNAPAAALTAAVAGALLHRHRRESERTASVGTGLHLLTGLVLGGLLLLVGAMQVGAQVAGARFLEQRTSSAAPGEQFASLERALTFRPYDHALRVLHTQAALVNDLEVARQDVEYLERIRPHDVQTTWLRIELLRSQGKRRDALVALQDLRRRDPYDRRAILWTAEIMVEVGQSPAAVVLLYGNPLLRDDLAGILLPLAQRAERGGNAADATLLFAEHAFVQAVDKLAAGNLIGAQVAYKEFLGRLDKTQRDARPLVLGAALLLAEDKRDAAETYAGVVRDRRFKQLYRDVMAPVLAPLRDLPAWREYLARQ